MPADHDRQVALVAAMRRPAFYPHETAAEIRLVQTHLSYVLLTGPYAYKISKAVQFSFVDYRSLAQRRHFCEEEIRLNRLYAPDLYIDTVPIFETEKGFSMEPSDGPAIEYAVQMHQFQDEDLLSRVFERGALTSDDVDFIARQIARFHKEGDASHEIAAFGAPEAVRAIVEDNFKLLDDFIGTLWSQADLDALRAYTDGVLNHSTDLLQQRVDEGRIRECHGDLHLGNICYYKGRIEFFDRIVFNDAFKNIDVFYDLAFLYMDLEYRDRPDLANELLNAYLEETNDFHGLPLLPFYACCRAIIRCKVLALKSAEEEVPEETRAAAGEEAKAYCALARRYAAATEHGMLVLMCGPSGSGKSTVAKHLAAQIGAVVIRSDAVRKHLAGHAPGEHAASIYTRGMTRRTYAFLIDEARRIGASGFPVVLDATFGEREHRERALGAFASVDVPVRIVRCRASEDTLRNRLESREGDISDADTAVLIRQLESFDELNDTERTIAIDLDTDRPINYKKLARAATQDESTK